MWAENEGHAVLTDLIVFFIKRIKFKILKENLYPFFAQEGVGKDDINVTIYASNNVLSKNICYYLQEKDQRTD